MVVMIFVLRYCKNVDLLWFVLVLIDCNFYCLNYLESKGLNEWMNENLVWSIWFFIFYFIG